MFSLKWARKEILTEQNVEFLFRFACREINTLDNTVVSIEQLFKTQFPEIFSQISLEELEGLSSRVMIVVDGLDELNGIYDTDSQLSKQARSLDSDIQQRIQNVLQMIMTNKDFLKDHKSIVCGRPKACEIVKSVLHNFQNLTKTVEVCGFSPENVQRYITQFFRFDNDNEKADRVRQALKMSSDLNFMASVPVFLWVICNVYSEDLLTEEVQSKTELYLYTTIVFMRNHLHSLSKYYHKDLFQLVRNEEFMKIFLSLATLSVQTYMYNKVLFTEDDINKLECPIHLEKTGFIVKTSSKTNVAKSVYQFRHLVLQEFLCSLYLCVSKDLKRFIGNLELTSCAASMLGINRLMIQNDNRLFTVLFENLTLSLPRKSFLKMIWSRLSSPSKSYDRYIANRNSELTIPDSLVKKQTLNLVVSFLPNETNEFLNNVYESKYVNTEGRKFESAKVIIQDDICRITPVLFILKALDIKHIEYLRYETLIDQFIKFSKDLMNLVSMFAHQEKLLIEILPEEVWLPELTCEHNRFTLRTNFFPKILEYRFELTEELKMISSGFYIFYPGENVKGIVRVFEDLIRYAVDSKKSLEIELAKELQQEFFDHLQTYPNLPSISEQLLYIHFK